MCTVFYSDHLPSINKVFLSVHPKFKQALIFCDHKFRNHPILKPWKNNKNLKFYYLPSGEKSKSLEMIPSHVSKILSLNMDFDKQTLCFISLGGGSLTDLTGFLASIYKRGVSVIHFPTTWLATLDSAHGGKTAINFKNIKNLLGSYHLPKAVFVVQDFLKQNPTKLKQEAWGELVKIAFIEGGQLYQKLKKEKTYMSLGKFLKPAIQAKMKLVKKDFVETQNIRKTLNLGHTVGHILEALCPLPHGTAVEQGLLFSINWSFHKGLLNKKNYNEMTSFISKKKKIKKISSVLFKQHLKQDKKHKHGKSLDFVFIKKPGAVIIQSVSEKDLLNEAKKQNLI